MLEINPFNMQYYIGDDLKEKPRNTDEFIKGIIHWKESLASLNDVKAKAKLHSKIGVHLRIAGSLNESLTQLSKAKQLLATLPFNKLFIVNEIRIAQTFQFLKRFDEATQLYEKVEKCIHKVIETNSTFANLLHFVYQHKGKNYFDQQQYQLAKTYFEKALKIRKHINDADLIASSVFALNITIEKLLK